MPRRKASDHNLEDLVDEEPPTSINPYAVLEVAQDATADQIKSAYRKAALKHHPDKAEDKEASHAKFQEIAFAYAVLSDPRRRSRYDTTGRTEETVDLEDDDFNWTDYYRAQYEGVVTEASIENFKNEYKGGEEEKKDLLEAYTKFKGSMNKIYQVVMLSNPLEDEERFRAIIDAAIAEKAIEPERYYTEESERSRQRRLEQAEKQRQEALEEGDKIKKKANKKKDAPDSLGDLAAMIQRRQRGRSSNFLDDLEAKYAPKPKKGNKRQTPMDEPPEEAFERTASRLKKGKK
ncbi:hypothetical protein IWX90DRAFT_485290 [Phyllosticta citrichinensis]|uniref:J domain-containing protein n=1 Tax=Phyllosticta citrichinensis TaxID=1130410 RepID=A0ABR1XVR1_9PEZI